MSNSTYDKLKFLALFAAPILTLLSSLCSIWNVPCASELTATFAAIDTCIGAIVVIAKQQYDKRQKEEQNG